MHTFLALVTTAGNMPSVDISGNMHYPYSIGLLVPYMFLLKWREIWNTCPFNCDIIKAH